MLLPKAGCSDGPGFKDLLSRVWRSLHANQRTMECLHMHCQEKQREVLSIGVSPPARLGSEILQQMPADIDNICYCTGMRACQAV